MRAGTRRGLVPVLFLVAVLTAPIAAQQGGGATSRIRILAAGGLLGQDDGMPEYPGGPFDTEVGPGMQPYGGLAGLTDWLREHPERDLFLMTANNLPRDVTTSGGASVIAFFQRVRQLRPDAIALGEEDFLRGLDGKRTAADHEARRNPSAAGYQNRRTGGLLVTRMRESGLPFVATNASVRLHKPGLNRVADRGFRLLVTPDSSIAWGERLSADSPCSFRQSLKQASALLESTNAGGRQPASGRINLTMPESGACRINMTLPERLRPGTTNQLTISVDGKPVASFSFHTDESLAHTALVPSRPELPIVVSLVDPRVRSILGAAKWRWRNDADSKCAADECEILLTDAAAALTNALEFAESTPTPRPVVLLSQLTDEDTADLLQQFPRIRIVVWPPDSLALGRAALRTSSARGRSGQAGGPFSGDLGYGAVLNMSIPTAAQVWSRPEWFAETVHSIEADVDAPRGGLSRIEHATHSVKGRVLCARQLGQGPEVGYFLQTWRMDTEKNAIIYDEGASDAPVSQAPYRYVGLDPEATFDPRGLIRQGTLWTNVDSFAAVALDAMRRGLNTDLAVLPADAIDDNWLTVLREHPRGPTAWLSRAFLERLLFRAGTIIKVRVSSNELMSTLSRIVSRANDEDVRSCLGGLGLASCTARMPSGALVNQRRLQDPQFYTIAMPESVALQHNLARYGSDEDEDDLVFMMDRMFAPAMDTATSTCGAGVMPLGQRQSTRDSNAEPIATRLEQARAKENQPYFFIKPAEVAFTETQVSEPPEGEGLFNSLAVPGNGARPSRRITVTLGMDAGLIDTPHMAVRVLGEFAYGRSIVNGQTSTQPNFSLVGARMDWKLGSRGRVFGGVFWETQFADEVQLVTATRQGVRGPTLPLVTQRRDYRFVSAGIQLVAPRFRTFLTLDPVSISAESGVSEHEHVDIQIDGNLQGLAAFQQFGPTGLLNRYYATHPELSSSSTYAFVDAALRRSRVRVDITPRTSVTLGGRRITISLAAAYRRFVGPNIQRLAERQSASLRLAVAIPIHGLISLNVGANGVFTQAHGINGWFRVWQPSVTLSIPVIGSRHGGWVF